MKPKRAKFIGAGIACVAVTSGALGFGPCVRSKVAAEANRRHLDVVVGGVRPGWFAVRLVDVTVRPHGAERVDATIGEVRIELGMMLGVERIAARGGHLRLDGSASQIASDLERWRAELPASGGASSARSIPILAEAMSLAWSDAGAARTNVAEATGLGFSRSESGTRVTAASARWHELRGDLEVGDCSIELDPTGKLRAAHAATAEIVLPQALDDAPADETSIEAAAPSSSASPPIAFQPAKLRPSKKDAARTPSTSPALGPLISLPNLNGWRAKARLIASSLAERLPDGAEVSVSALTFKLVKASNRDASTLSFGPGPFVVRHEGTLVALRFSTNALADGTPLSASAKLPLDDAEVSVNLEGGPVSLAVLGVKDGAFGVTDVEHATVAGKGRVALSSDALTFDGDLRVRGASIAQSKLASEVLRGLDVGVSARGVLSDRGEVRLDDFTAKIGALHVSASGTLVQAAEHGIAKLRFEVPSASCQSLLDSVPTGLLPSLRGAKYTGTFGARGVLELDSRAVDEMVLTYDVQDRCAASEVPAAIARERFKRPFAHRTYLPDGTASEETTGPGSGKWVPFGAISPFMTVAVLTTEDGGFYRHHGFSHGAIKSSIIANLKARRFVRGASTISMQLAKNLFLVREKTLSRKLEEVVLTDYLEQVFTKDELMELYLNVIEFGPNVYGIGPASYHYFGRSPSELNLAECLFLSSMLPAPIRYHYLKDQGQLSDSWQRTIQHLMSIAKRSGLISEEELEEGKSEAVVFYKNGARPPARRHSHLDAPVNDGDTVSQESN